jgi:transposase
VLVEWRRAESFSDGARSEEGRTLSKKKSFVASEQDRPDVAEKRARFREAILELKTGRLIFVDETGVNVAMSSLWARAPIGERAVCKRPANDGGNISVVGALAADGIVAYHAVYGAMDTERFEDFVVRKLAPKLGARDIVLMDNVRFHKAECIRAAIEKTGAKLQFLPPYSPELNPIEEVWSFFKNLMRKAAARDVPNLVDALVRTMQAITGDLAKAFIKHAGYPHFS